MASSEALDSALDLLLRLPPQQVSRNLANICKLVPELEEDLESCTDQPLAVSTDACSNKEYVLCEYNRDVNSHRSPWCNKYHPTLSGGFEPQHWMRKLEIKCNDAFSKYMDMYYDGGVSSVYFWPVENHFAAAILLKKSGNTRGKTQGSWDSIHVVEIKETVTQKHESKRNPREDRMTSHDYTMTSSIMLWLQTNKHVSGLMNIGGSVTRQTKRTVRSQKPSSHLIHIGELVEEQENHMRAQIYDIYFWKTKDIVTRCLRCATTVKRHLEERRNSRMLDASKAVIRRTPSGKHLLVPAGDSVHV